MSHELYYLSFLGGGWSEHNHGVAKLEDLEQLLCLLLIRQYGMYLIASYHEPDFRTFLSITNLIQFVSYLGFILFDPEDIKIVLEQSTWKSYLVSGFAFITGKHPDFDVCLLEITDALGHIILQDILYSCHSY